MCDVSWSVKVQENATLVEERPSNVSVSNECMY